VLDYPSEGVSNRSWFLMKNERSHGERERPQKSALFQPACGQHGRERTFSIIEGGCEAMTVGAGKAGIHG
jgi:hypothetical protein